MTNDTEIVSIASSVEDTTDKKEQVENLRKLHEKNVQDANNRAINLFQHFLSQSRWTYGITLSFYILSFVIAMIILGISIYLAILMNATTFMHIFSIGSFIIGIAIIGIILISNPIKHFRRYQIDLIKINVIFNGYMRQIYQIDSEFQKTIILCGPSNLKEIIALSKPVQGVVEQTVDALSTGLDQIDI